MKSSQAHHPLGPRPRPAAHYARQDGRCAFCPDEWRTAPLEEVDVKKLVVLAVAAAAGFLIWKKLQDDQAEQDLWTEATNEFADLR